MSEFFNPDSSIMRFITKIASSVYLNILWFVCCLPVVTIGASTTALFYVTLKMAKNEEGNMTAAFFHSFRQISNRPQKYGWSFWQPVSSLLSTDMSFTICGLKIQSGPSEPLYSLWHLPPMPSS